MIIIPSLARICGGDQKHHPIWLLQLLPHIFPPIGQVGFVQKYCRCLQKNSEQIANPAHLRRHIFVFFVFAVWAYPLSAPSHLARAAARLLGKEVDNTRPSSKLLHLLLHSSLLSIDFFSRPELSIDVWDSKANVHFADKIHSTKDKILSFTIFSNLSH